MTNEARNIRPESTRSRSGENRLFKTVKRAVTIGGLVSLSLALPSVASAAELRQPNSAPLLIPCPQGGCVMPPPEVDRPRVEVQTVAEMYFQCGGTIMDITYDHRETLFITRLVNPDGSVDFRAASLGIVPDSGCDK